MGRSFYDLPLRVTFYARVSSESDEQLNSLGNQIQYYESLIRKNANWTYVAGYIDEGLSAATTRKRENFHRMVEDGRAGLFDLIITKEITRFARNTLDSIQYTRELLNATDMAIDMKQKGILGKPCPDYVDETVSMKVVRIIQGYVNVVNKMVWRKG